MSHARTIDALRAVLLLAAPALLASCTNTIDPLGDDIPIADLTTAEAQSWCASSFEAYWGTPPPPDQPVQPDGTVSSVPPTMHGFQIVGIPLAGVCSMQLSVDQCVANLTLHPCQATLQALDACMQEVFATDNNTDFHACDAYHATPSCDQTILAPLMSSATQPIVCELPVR